MAKKKINPILLFLEKYLGAGLIMLLSKTWRFNYRTPIQKDNVILATWHRNMLPMLIVHKNTKTVVLISSSDDGELIAGPAKVFGYQTARGSSTRGGIGALMKLVKQVKKYPVAVSPDGPKGPSQKIKDGVLMLAFLSKKPIVPIAVDIDRERLFNSWDKFRFPKLFAKINVSYGEPFYVNSKEEIESKNIELQEVMEKLEFENKIYKNIVR